MQLRNNLTTAAASAVAEHATIQMRNDFRRKMQQIINGMDSIRKPKPMSMSNYKNFYHERDSENLLEETLVSI